MAATLQSNSVKYQPLPRLDGSQTNEWSAFQDKSIEEDQIINVYMDNFFSVMETIENLIDTYNFIGMDTEFPGTVYCPPEETHDFEYQLIKANVDNLKLIQVGIALADYRGISPQQAYCWQFNLQFDIDQEMSNPESIDVLKEADHDFEKFKTQGIPHQLFAEYWITHGLCLNPNLNWITYHGGSDFAYLLRTLHGSDLPKEEAGFLDMCDLYFGNYYDVKEIKKYMNNMGGSLNQVSQILGLQRIGTNHQAGSDALVTKDVFFKLIEREDYKGYILSQNKLIFGLGQQQQKEQYYITEYKQIAREYGPTSNGKLLNTVLIKQGGQNGELNNKSISTASSNSQNGILKKNLNPPVVNQQHYLQLAQQQQQIKGQMMNENQDDGYNNYYRQPVPQHLDQTLSFYGAPLYNSNPFSMQPHQGMYFERYGSPPAAGISPPIMMPLPPSAINYFNPALNGKNAF